MNNITNPNKRWWTLKEDKILIKYKTVLSREAIAKLVNRTPRAVKNRELLLSFGKKKAERFHRRD